VNMKAQKSSTAREARILVVGDVMLDRYWFGEVNRISPEAPVPVVRIERREERLGGAANVARNAAALGSPVGLLGVVGQDEAGNAVDAMKAGGKIKIKFTRTENEILTELQDTGEGIAPEIPGIRMQVVQIKEQRTP